MITQQTELVAAADIDLAIAKVAADTKDRGLSTLLATKSYDIFSDEGARLLKELRRIANDNPALRSHIQQITRDFTNRMDWIKKNYSPEADG